MSKISQNFTDLVYDPDIIVVCKGSPLNPHFPSAFFYNDDEPFRVKLSIFIKIKGKFICLCSIRKLDLNCYKIQKKK